MNSYEALLEESYNNGLIVKEKPLKYNDGRIKGNRIAIRKDIDTITEKACVLAEELGHHHTTVGNILNMDNAGNRKQERRARLWSYDRMIGLSGLIRAFEHGCKSKYEIAEYLDVTVDYLEDAIECYRSKYGTHTSVGKYEIYFIPNLSVLKMF